MEYLMLIYEPSTDFDARTAENKEAFWGAWTAYHQALVEAKVFKGGNPLQVPSTGTTVRVKHDKRQVQDGPYADTKEQLGGYILIDVPSLDEALDWAARCPAAASGAVEVRPIVEM